MDRVPDTQHTSKVVLRSRKRQQDALMTGKISISRPRMDIDPPNVLTQKQITDVIKLKNVESKCFLGFSRDVPELVQFCANKIAQKVHHKKGAKQGQFTYTANLYILDRHGVKRSAYSKSVKTCMHNTIFFYFTRFGLIDTWCTERHMCIKFGKGDDITVHRLKCGATTVFHQQQDVEIVYKQGPQPRYDAVVVQINYTLAKQT